VNEEAMAHWGDVAPKKYIYKIKNKKKNIKTGTDCFPCEIRTEGKEKADGLSISTGHDRI